jgi:toxin FitB
MKDYLIDTCIISEFAKKKPNLNVKDWFKNSIKKHYLSVITVEEFLFGLKWNRPTETINRFKNFMIEEFCVLEITPQIAELCSDFRNNSRKLGIITSQADALIAATAKQNNLILVTRNEKDFSHFDLQILNPFNE